MRDLPEQMIEITFATRRGNLLVNRVAANRTSTASAFVINTVTGRLRAWHKVYNGNAIESCFYGHRLVGTLLGSERADSSISGAPINQLPISQ